VPPPIIERLRPHVQPDVNQQLRVESFVQRTDTPHTDPVSPRLGIERPPPLSQWDDNQQPVE
jgi:hypothetical protein